MRGPHPLLTLGQLSDPGRICYHPGTDVPMMVSPAQVSVSQLQTQVFSSWVAPPPPQTCPSSGPATLSVLKPATQVPMSVLDSALSSHFQPTGHHPAMSTSLIAMNLSPSSLTLYLPLLKPHRLLKGPRAPPSHCIYGSCSGL